MPISTTFRTTDNDRWGAGKGSNLTAAEFDTNTWNLKSAIEDLQDNPPVPVSISSVTTTGTKMTLVMSDASTIGPIQLPILRFRWKGEYQPDMAYAVLDTFKVTGTGIFTVQIAHTSGSTFDPDIQVGGEDALWQLFGAAEVELLSELSDVSIAAVADGDFLVYDGGSPAVWRNLSAAEVATALGIVTTFAGLSDVDMTGITDGQIPRWDAGAGKFLPSDDMTGSGSGVDLLSELGDVNVTSPADDDFLVRESGEWRNRSLAEVQSLIGAGSGAGADLLSELGDVDIPTDIADGDVLTFVEADNNYQFRAPASSGSGGGGSFNPTGPWDDTAAYDAFDVATFDVGSAGTKAFLCYSPVSTPSGLPQAWAAATGMTLSTTTNTDDTATSTAGANHQVISTDLGKTTGKWYFEGIFSGLTDSGAQFGIANVGLTANAGGNVGGSISGGGSGGGSGSFAGLSNSTRAAVAIDVDNDLFWIAADASSPNWNGTSADPAAGTGGIAFATALAGATEVYPNFYSPSSASQACQLIAYLGDLEGVPPLGFSAIGGTGSVNPRPDEDPEHWIGGV